VSSASLSIDGARPYFTPEAMKFLRGLKKNNRREWFEPRRSIFEQEIKQPMLALITAVNAAMEGFAPEHVRAPQKIMLRIYRDTRFSADKTPYKRHIAAWWTRAGLEKTSGAGFYLHVGADEVVAAAGVYMPEREQLHAIRTWLLEHHAEFRGLLEDPKLRRKMPELEGLALSRPPKGFPADHPAIDLLKCKQWGVSAMLTSDEALNPTLAKEITGRFRLASGLVHALNEPLSASATKSRKPLFAL
jgi:uncharacterized protein (TIGR02453 family)